MASSKTEICNLALAHLGISSDIANVDTEQSTEASTMRRFYETARDECFRDINWPFASKIVALGLVEENPNDEWSFSYRYPDDCLKMKRILSGIRNDNRQSRVPYKISKDDSGVLIFTDMQDAEAEYTSLVEDTSLYPVDFTMALSYKLAFYTAPRLTKGDPFGLGAKSAQNYMLYMNKAANNAFNELQDEQDPEAEFIRSRE